MRITRLKATNFRGWADLDLQQLGHVLDPRSSRLTAVVRDIHQRQVVSDPETGTGGEDDVALSGEATVLGGASIRCCWA